MWKESQDVNISKKEIEPEISEQSTEKESDARKNYRIQSDTLGVGLPRERIEANLCAIRTLKELEQQNRPATESEQDAAKCAVQKNSCINL